MSENGGESLSGPDLRTVGAASSELPDGGMLLGHFNGEPVLLVRKGTTVHAMGAKCTHYGGPLAEGLFDGSVVRCPWHHACFRPETGEAVHAPAFDPVACYSTEKRGGRLFVNQKLSAPPAHAPSTSVPSSVIIVGGGAAGFAAAEMLRRLGYERPVTIISGDDAGPYDRPNISKDYLAGKAPEEWIPLRPLDWYQQTKIDLLTGRRIVRLIPDARAVGLDDGRRLEYGALLLATGASPVKLNVAGADLPHVFTLRTLRDSRAIIERATTARHAVVVGASFIGLEVAASLRTRGLDVHVVAPDEIPMQRVLGPELGRFVRELHEQHGVQFHLGQTVTSITGKSATLKNGTTLDADLVVVGIGVRPNLDLAEQAGLRIDRGVLVDEYLRTSNPHIWAAGDIVRWPDRYSGTSLRVEHWVVAEQQGQAAARNMLGLNQPYAAVPFFWSAHYDVTIAYVGAAPEWDEASVTGSIPDRDCLVAYRKNGKIVAVASVNRDVESLRVQAAMERGDAVAVEACLRPR
ncbi:FAD-dependent pyridine nucleotide-disulfide oxidoreductase [Nitrospira japonica]|uniref:FAD-dependent pyridine nucleotide-disulfide oxidoreductase n=1 Tax=Nitrospira japonica TaxID=1325564 RepID=A0A1W1I8W7_9BACT|nr:FAD-dependent oxidoreductase [Nitrospira japonica]SLM49457.1 FAD-dependent pyridine nucleotide-disulfide oxidoreductase [Nitrospira japonica]